MKSKNQGLMKSKAVMTALVVGLLFTSCSKDSSGNEAKVGKPTTVDNTVDGKDPAKKQPKRSEVEIKKTADFEKGPINYTDFTESVAGQNESIKTMRVEMTSEVYVEDKKVTYTNTASVDQTKSDAVKTLQKLVADDGTDNVVTNEFLTVGDEIWKKVDKHWVQTNEQPSFMSVVTATSMFQYFEESKGSVESIVYEGLTDSKLHKFVAKINPEKIKSGSTSEAKGINATFLLNDKLQVTEMTLILANDYGFSTTKIKQSAFNEPVKIEEPEDSKVVELPETPKVPETTTTTVVTTTTVKPKN